MGAANPNQTGNTPTTPLAIVTNGQPNAEIVIAVDRPRMVTLAALELRHYVEKMSGARLPIVTEPSADETIKIYLGESERTAQLGIDSKGLHYGAFRIASGFHWIVVIGRDKDYVPPAEASLSRSDIPRANAAWEEKTKGVTVGWGNPFRSMFRKYWNPNNLAATFNAYYGDDAAALWQGNQPEITGTWEYDESGTLYGVYELLHQLGVHWFMPGALGEVVPSMATVKVPALNETIEPGFAVRDWLYYGYSGFPFEQILYGRRLRMNSGIERIGPLVGPHGLVNVTQHPAMKAAHPEYYAFVGGEYDTEHRGYGTPNFTSEGLYEETVKFVRFMYDEYDLPMVDLWPVDGLVNSQDEQSSGLSPSELVWGFTDRVAREVYKTHPDRLVSGGAYASYRVPPDTIKQFSPNLLVQISNAGRPRMLDAEHWDSYRERVEMWASRLTPGNILRYENNRYHISDPDDPQIVFPVIHPRAVARDIQFLNGKTVGETGEQSQRRLQWCAPALNHINLYVQSSMLWDPEADVDELLANYFVVFYGPAARQMAAAVAYAEDSLAVDDRTRGKVNVRNVSLDTQLRFRKLLEEARQAAGDSVYGERVDAVIAELATAEAVIERHERLVTAAAEARASAPEATGVIGSDLSDAPWYTMINNVTGEDVEVKTRFRIGWEGDAILFEIVSSKPDMENLVSTADVYSGEYLALSIETQLHSFYHIEISPDGDIVNYNPEVNSWQSMAEITTEKGDDYWRALVRIPVVGMEEFESDPNHRIAGLQPTTEDPWYINVGRNRIVGGRKAELQSFSPTGGNWRQPIKFGKLAIIE